MKKDYEGPLYAPHPDIVYEKSIKIELLKLLKEKSYKYGDYTLTSGRKSKHYVNCKPVILSGLGLTLVSTLLLEKVEKYSKAVGGLTLGADPLVSGVALVASQLGRSLDALIIRKEPKGHGTGAWIEGPLPAAGSRVTILEDVITTGGSSIKAAQKLRDAGYWVDRVVSIVDRQDGTEAYDAMIEAKLELISLFTLEDFIN